jgi:galactokinase
LGVPALRDASCEDLGRLGGLERRLARHVVTENARVQAVADLLRAGRIDQIGPLLTESHASMRDDFAITVPRVDVAVQTLLDAGALGARMTGGGFGGCVIALLPEGEVDAAVEAAREAYLARGWDEPVAFTVVASAGAHRLG